ncbi:hypothetical protein CCX46_04900 [Pseudomonas sp. RU47]|nr:hypothetical protein CCX46_04900 [Pseudomonas sp. RU47]QHF49048.1 hypothetical protein PspS49_05250 [Pseudomonas sp. S49]
MAGWRKGYVRDHPYSVTFVRASRRNTLTVLRLEVTAEISPAEIQVTANKRVLEDATCVAGFGGLSS